MSEPYVNYIVLLGNIYYGLNLSGQIMNCLLNLGEIPVHREIKCLREVTSAISSATTVAHPNIVSMISQS